MYVVAGVLKEYDWGRVDGLVPWCEATGGPQAELWFGDHPAGPSPVLHPGQAGGTHLDVDAPLLVKMLAAGAPLSLQVHPDLERARAGYARQSAGGPRPYADDREKTELLLALEPFEALAGWREAPSCASVLAGCGLTGAAVAAAAAGDHAGAVRALLGLDRRDCVPAVSRLPVAAGEAGLPPAAAAALARIAGAYPDDPGALVAVLLDHVRLDVGDAVYVPAGVPHSYLDGLGIEVMTSSDSVLRLGLTRKLVSVDDAVAAFRDDRRPMVLRADPAGLVAPPGAPFRLVLRRDGTVTLPAGSYRVVVAVHGRVRVDCAGTGVPLPPGRAAVLRAVDPEATVVVHGTAVLVTEGVEATGGQSG